MKKSKDFLKSGGIKFNIKHPDDQDWATNNKPYNFGTYENRGVSLTIIKHPDRTLQIDISGPFNESAGAFTQLPPDCPSVLSVAISWGNRKISLYLDSKLVSVLHL